MIFEQYHVGYEEERWPKVDGTVRQHLIVDSSRPRSRQDMQNTKANLAFPPTVVRVYKDSPVLAGKVRKDP